MSSVIVNQINAALNAGKRSSESELVSDYDELYRQIDKLEGMVREAFQGKLSAEYLSLVEKLERGEELTAAARDALELLIVGEAKHYLKAENDFDNWKNELQRLAGEMEKAQATDLASIDDLMHLEALCRDVKTVLPDVTFYLRERERVKRFEEAMRETLDPESRRFLAEIIKGMMKSSKA